jgi:A118 family predicted phage portal protein
VHNTGADGEPIQYISNVTQPLYGFFRYPMPNNIDPNSPLGVACFSYAQTPNNGINLIEQADKILSNLFWEFKTGERAIYVDPLAFDADTATGKPVLPDQRLYRTLQRTTDIGGKGNMFDDWSPEFREAAINNGLNSVLKRIEFNCRLAYGTISDPQTVDRTATEILSSRQRSYVTVTTTQEALEAACDGLLYAMNVLADLYKLAPRGTYSVVYDFDDSVITDKNTEFMQLNQEVAGGITSKIEYRMRVKGEDEFTARKMLAMVDEERANQPTDFFAESGV